MRRSICLTEPNRSFAGQVGTWLFTFQTATALPKGTRLRFDMMTNGRDIDWEIPSSSSKSKKNVIWATMPNDKVIYATEVENPESFCPFFEFTLPSEIKSGGTFTIKLGTPESKASTTKGNSAQCTTQRRRPFHLFIDTKGKGDFKDPEIFTLDIRGNELSQIRVIAPSAVARNKRFDLIVRFEDDFGNLTSNAPEGTLIELSYEQLRENLNWKLFVPETGFITLPNLYFNEPGVYKIKMANMQTGETFFSPPLRCLEGEDHSLYWGLFHGESERVDSSDDIESCLRHFRDDRAFNFFGTSPFDSQEETPNEIWKKVASAVAELNEEDRFITFLGFQWIGSSPADGIRNFVFNKDSKQMIRSGESKSNSLKKIYKTANPKELISIPTFTMGKGTEYDFSNFDPEFEKVVEIYNAWGCSECTKKEGNLFPITPEGKAKGVTESPKGSIRAALNNNNRFGFVAGGLDDRDIYCELFESDQAQYNPGLTAIMASDQNRSSILDALQKRQCYATTGERIIVGLFVAGSKMGTELNTTAKPGLAFNRHITGYVAGTDNLKAIELIRNGKVIHTFTPKGFTFDILFDDSEGIDSITLDSPDSRPPFIYYYIRVIQNDGHVAWSSPIWVDHTEAAAPTPAKKRKKKS